MSKIRATAYYEKEMKPICRIFAENYTQGVEALYDILELVPPAFYKSDVAFTENEPMVAPVDAEEYRFIGERVKDWYKIAEGLSELKTEDIFDVIKFVQLVLDAYGEGERGPIVVVSQEVQ